MGADNWRELLDDPHVESVIQRAVTVYGRRHYWRESDRLLLDDLESFLWDRSVEIAEKSDAQPGTTRWYAFLWACLENATRVHRRTHYGKQGSERNRAHRPGNHVSIEEDLARAAEYGPGSSLLLHNTRMRAADPLQHLLRIEALERTLRKLEATPPPRAAYTTASDQCAEVLCPKSVEVAGYCRAHYQKNRELWKVGLCSIDGCTSGILARGLCNAHYKQARKTNADAWRAAWPVVCSVPDCGGPIKGRGLCVRHYTAAKRRGEL